MYGRTSRASMLKIKKRMFKILDDEPEIKNIQLTKRLRIANSTVIKYRKEYNEKKEALSK